MWVTQNIRSYHGLDWIGSLTCWIGMDWILQNGSMSNSEATAQSRCQTLCSSIANGKKIKLLEVEGARVPMRYIAGDDNVSHYDNLYSRNNNRYQRKEKTSASVME